MESGFLICGQLPACFDSCAVLRWSHGGQLFEDGIEGRDGVKSRLVPDRGKCEVLHFGIHEKSLRLFNAVQIDKLEEILSKLLVDNLGQVVRGNGKLFR